MEKEYEFDTEDGKKTLAELFDGRSQLLAYNIMFGPDYEVGACPGGSNLGDELDATRVHLNHRDATLICFSRAPIERLVAYKQRMGWQFPYVSTNGTEFPFDLGLTLTPEQAEQIPEINEILDNPPEWLQDWARQVGAKLEDGLRENPSFIAFARENGTAYHTYTVAAPDPFVAPYNSFCSGERRSPGPTSPAPGARMSTPTDSRGRVGLQFVRRRARGQPARRSTLASAPEHGSPQWLPIPPWTRPAADPVAECRSRELRWRRRVARLPNLARLVALRARYSGHEGPGDNPHFLPGRLFR